MMHNPKISVVVCAHNAAGTLAQQMDAVLAQDTSFPFELIVVDNESTDATHDVASGYAERDPRVRVIPASPKGLNVARNAGVAAASAELIAMCDADDEVEQGWLQELVGTWVPGVYLAGALRYAGPNSARVQHRWGAANAEPVVPTYPMNGVPTAAGCNCLYSREMWIQAGRFDERFSGAGDESEFFARASDFGYEWAPAPGAVVSYRLPGTARDSLRRGYRFGNHGSAVRATRGAEPDARLVAKQILWLLAHFPKVLLAREGYFKWLHTLGKRTGEVRYLLDERRGR